MSYRTYIEGKQVFGNNVCYREWDEFIKSCGIQMDEDGGYEGDITDVKGMFNTIDLITRRLIKERHRLVERGRLALNGKPYKELTDLSDSMYLDGENPVLMFAMNMVENAYCFLPYQVYMAVKDKIEPAEERYVIDGVDWSYCSYKIKDGESIHVDAG